MSICAAPSIGLPDKECDIPPPLQASKEVSMSLVARLRGADAHAAHQAAEELCDRYRGKVFAIVIGRGIPRDSADDLCQDIFLRAVQKIDQLKDPCCLPGWIGTMARRMSLNAMMRVRRGVGKVLSGERQEPGYSPLETVLLKEQKAQMRGALNRLTDLDRNTLIAFYFHGQSLVEMANAFRAPVGTIKRRLHVARKRLAKEMEAAGVTAEDLVA